MLQLRSSDISYEYNRYSTTICKTGFIRGVYYFRINLQI